MILKYQRVCVNGKSSAYVLEFFFFAENKLLVVDTEKAFLLLEFEP